MKYSEVFPTRLSRDIAKHLREYAQARDMAASTVVRQAVRFYLESQRNAKSLPQIHNTRQTNNEQTNKRLNRVTVKG